MATVTRPIDDVRAHIEDVPDEVASLIRRLTAIDREMRPADGNAAALEIDRLLRLPIAQAPAAPPVPAPPPPGQTASLNPDLVPTSGVGKVKRQ